MRVILAITLLAASLLASPADAQDITTGLQLWWKLDEGSGPDGDGGTTVADSSGNGRHGKIRFGPAVWTAGTWVTGHDGMALSRSMARISSISNIPPPATLTAWVKRTTLPSDLSPPGDTVSSQPYFWFETDWGGMTTTGDAPAVLKTRPGPGSVVVVFSSLQLPDDVWCLIGYAFTATSVKAWLYNSQTAAFNSETISTTAWATDPGGGAFQFSSPRGSFDDVRVYNRALSDCDVKTLAGVAC